MEAVAMAWRCVRAADGLLARDSGIAEERCIHDALIPATVSVACEGGEKKALVSQSDDEKRRFAKTGSGQREETSKTVLVVSYRSRR